jgi:hypothetical protein
MHFLSGDTVNKKICQKMSCIKTGKIPPPPGGENISRCQRKRGKSKRKSKKVGRKNIFQKLNFFKKKFEMSSKEFLGKKIRNLKFCPKLPKVAKFPYKND